MTGRQASCLAGRANTNCCSVPTRGCDSISHLHRGGRARRTVLDGGLLLAEIVRAVSARCGEDFPLLVKVSHGDDRGLPRETVLSALKRVEARLDAVEASYGAMEYALNIIRGACPVDEVLRVNPLFGNIPAPVKARWKACVYPFKNKALKEFAYDCNLAGALAFKQALSLPAIPVGGLHRLDDLEIAFMEHGFAAASFCRPFICEPDLSAKIRARRWRASSLPEIQNPAGIFREKNTAPSICRCGAVSFSAPSARGCPICSILPGRCGTRRPTLCMRSAAIWTFPPPVSRS